MVDFSERITILTANEIGEIYGLPTFSDEERELYFAMDAKEQRIAFRHRTQGTAQIRAEMHAKELFLYGGLV